MPEKQEIFPADVLADTVEYHFNRYNPATVILYRILLAMAIIALVAIMLIRVDVSVKSLGVIKAPTEHNEVKTLVSGRVDDLLIHENMRVKAGQILLTIQSNIIEQQSSLTTAQKSEFEQQVRDLELLTRLAKAQNWSTKPVLESPLYNQQYNLFLQKINQITSLTSVARKNYNRNLHLYKQKVISAAEFDNIKLIYQNANNELQLAHDAQASQWQSDLNRLKLKVQELNSQGTQINEEKEFYTLRAPVSGTVQELKGIQHGSAVAANEILAEISPDSGLVAEAYVLPKDIGMIQAGTKARFQVDAYNYNQWGTLTGHVISVSNDIYARDGQQPHFRVRCRLDNYSLKLKNGYEGKLKKGMTMQTRFFVTRRTIFQLLYDKADDWLNPGRLPQNVTNNERSAAF